MRLDASYGLGGRGTGVRRGELAGSGLRLAVARGRSCRGPPPTPFVLALVVLLLVTLVAVRRLRLPDRAVEAETVRAVDGWKLVVWRYPNEGRPAVILCHGIGSTRFLFDFDDRLSLARYLCDRGFDVFVVELRRPVTALGERAAPDWRRRWPFTLDDHVRGDVPALQDHVLSKVEHERVFWIGHSMGGMIGYAAMGSPWSDRSQGVVTLAAPTTFGHLGWLGPTMRFASSVFPVVPGRLLGRCLGPWAGSFPLPFLRAIANPDNIGGPVHGSRRGWRSGSMDRRIPAAHVIAHRPVATDSLTLPALRGRDGDVRGAEGVLEATLRRPVTRLALRYLQAEAGAAGRVPDLSVRKTSSARQRPVRPLVLRRGSRVGNVRTCSSRGSMPHPFWAAWPAF